MVMIKNEIVTVEKQGINYLIKNGSKEKFKPWLGDIFSFLYDSIMSKSVFPKKLEASIEKHTLFLKNEYVNIHNCNVLELGTGSGNLTQILPRDNRYTGIDISRGLLRIAYKKFKKAGFKNPKLFLCSSEELPFEDMFYNICICNLSLNFFGDLDNVVKEIKRVLKKQGVFICSVPLSERKQNKDIIRGKLYSENELKEIFEKNGFLFTPLDFNNGALFYFKASVNI